jgi:hypothetical protein
MEPVQWRYGDDTDADPFVGDVRNENLLLLRPTLPTKTSTIKKLTCRDTVNKNTKVIADKKNGT